MVLTGCRYDWRRVTCVTSGSHVRPPPAIRGDSVAERLTAPGAIGIHTVYLTVAWVKAVEPELVVHESGDQQRAGYADGSPGY